MSSKDKEITEQPKTADEKVDTPAAASEENNEKKDEVAEEEEAAGASMWGGFSSWMSKDVLDKAMSSVNTAVESAKQKSNEVYGLVSKDLGEVSTQATSMVRSTSTNLKKTLESDWYYCDPNMAFCGVDSTFAEPPNNMTNIEEAEDFDEKSDVLADKAYENVKKASTSAWRYMAGYATQMFSEEDLESEAMVVQGEEPVPLNRLQAQLYALASDPDTFLTDPHPDDKLGADFESWECDLDKRQGEISDMMVTNKNIRQHYTTMVPDHVTHKIFWRRYFFKVHLIELQENRRQALKKKAAEATKESAEENEINWDDVADLTGGGEAKEIPENVQDRLLKDYERELIAAKVSKAGDDLKKELSIKEKKTTSPDKDETSSDDWEKLSSGEKSPRKSSSKDEEEEWVRP